MSIIVAYQFQYASQRRVRMRQQCRLCNGRVQLVFAGAGVPNNPLWHRRVGHVGAEVLRRFRALGCVTLACDPPRQESGDPLTYDFEGLSPLSSCDVVSLHVPLNSFETS